MKWLNNNPFAFWVLGLILGAALGLFIGGVIGQRNAEMRQASMPISHASEK